MSPNKTIYLSAEDFEDQESTIDQEDHEYTQDLEEIVELLEADDEFQDAKRPQVPSPTPPPIPPPGFKKAPLRTPPIPPSPSDKKPKAPPPPPREKKAGKGKVARTPPPHSEKKPKGPPPPPESQKKKVQKLQGTLAITPTHIDTLTTLLYRVSLLGATYARPQIRTIRIFFQKVMGCSPAQLRRVRDQLKKLQSQDLPLVPPPLDSLAPLIPLLPYAVRAALVHNGLFLIGCKTLRNLERYREFLAELAIELRIDPNDVNLFDLFGIGAEEIQLSVNDCWRLLDVEEGASEAEIRKSHRKMVRNYHPDQFHSKGSEFVRLAERKMKEANMALEILLYRSDRDL